MAPCFVIQPFDGGRLDKRYANTFKPATEARVMKTLRRSLLEGQVDTQS